LGDTEIGITLKTYLEYEKIFTNKREEVRKNIISAFGIDNSNKNSKIIWETFL
jgi:hypothetical protein